MSTNDTVRAALEALYSETPDANTTNQLASKHGKPVADLLVAKTGLPARDVDDVIVSDQLLMLNRDAFNLT